ncbi:hypothetical protein [Sphaerisporangium perillae]|uniref:hypothetical protein n=1 Tax=Sphaerisporangium perillae TaxID=2935860 RepID=UPI00200C3A31|nr:hypothetical protein [Sphaerisporangium perillae]
MSPRPPRSHLYVPADQPRFLRSALRTAADALILDLEDAHLRSLGFQGRACIHPDQVTIANEVFGVDDAELADAHALLDLFERHQRSGSGAFRDAHGAMVDAATVRRARDLTGRTAT